jgi:hypothetical protein
MLRALLIFSVFFTVSSQAQTIGGSSVYNFLKVPNTPQLSGLGSINISNISNDVGLTFNSPALLRPEMNSQLNLVFNSLYAGIKNYHLSGAWYAKKIQTSFASGLQYFHYGSVPETDAAGNILGTFRPVDYVVQVSASRRYETKWFYGLTAKFIHSNYGQYRSSAIAMDAGVAFMDSSSMLQLSLVAKNMGAQIKTYAGSPEDLPFDLQLGITKRLSKAPIQFSLTAHHLHQFDIRFSDTSETGKFTADKIFRHFVFATQLLLEQRVEITLAYNYLRRKELTAAEGSAGLNGFSLGLGVLFKKIQLRYARSYYTNSTAYNQLGLNLKTSDFFKLSGR